MDKSDLTIARKINETPGEGKMYDKNNRRLEITEFGWFNA
jgi:hypothetical protein